MHPSAHRPVVVLASLMLLLCGNNVSAQQSKVDKKSEFDRAVELYKHGDNFGAIELLQKVLEQNANNADAWYFLGLACYDSGWFWRAGDAFEHLLRFRPNTADAHAKLSYALILGSQSERAVVEAQRAIELGDSSPEPYYAIAEANLRARNYEEAVDRANHALKIKSAFGLALITKSMALYYLDRYPEAIAALESFLQTNANDPEADLWREQLERIRAREARKKSLEPTQPSEATEDRIFSGREVTTKARVLAKPEPTYSESARQAGVTGTVILRAVFSGKGEVTDIFVAQALSYGLNLKAVTAAKAIRFVPATKDGKPVSMWMELQYNFELY